MADFSYTDAIDQAKTAALAYYDGSDELMTDAEYDHLLDRIREYEKANPDDVVEHGLFTAVAAGVSVGGNVTYDVPMLSLDKVKDLADIESFVDRVAAAGGTVRLEAKFDGMAFNARYENGTLAQVSTRGDGVTGEDLTDNVMKLHITGLPKQLGSALADGVLNVRGELLMTRDDFEFSNANRVASGKPAFANPRNATAGSVRKSDLDYDVRLTFMAYDSDRGIQDGNLELAGFTTSSGLDIAADSTDVIARVLAFGDERKAADFPYPTDGVVLKVVEPEVWAALGTTSRAPRWAVAYKYEAETAVSAVLDIIEGVGRTGNISYTAIFDPVTVDGSTISRATLHNPSIIAELGVGIGSVVQVFKANDIIPRVGRVVENPEGVTPYIPSDVSPSGAPLDKSAVIWRSTDPADSIGALISYAGSRDALDIDGFSTAIADALVSGERPLVNDLGDLFTLQFQQLANLSLGTTEKGTKRFLGGKVAEKILANIDAAKAQPLNRVITALGIRKSGRTFGRRLANHFHTMDALLAATEEDFLTSGIEGVGPERAALFHEGFQRNRAVIDKLRAAGVNMGEEPEQAAEETAAALPLAGMKVVISGALNGPLAGTSRNEANELVERMGGQSSGSVSKTTSLLVSSEVGTSKWQKATDLGVRIVTPEEFAEMIGR
ncbi:NAD-dependent DNA ligase LigA [Curtobacterium sp. MCBD17_040]|uniref:NAD-dependent DNA ligase LigA n=1 Tax=Curtobacterium sp. MCBD17_040 TaxID=2175674 RepID=UPI0015E8C508|nr:NAD-dependent DNA ligase LigA [Curtobacterium sp. MCBD17_040]WIB65366.1 NAD-dependent DNA ligase LigA [Curtobacterium sp. MCBD17_040]